MPRSNPKLPDPRDAFLASSLSKHNTAVPQGVIDDLKYFRGKIDAEGKRLTWTGLQKWMADTHKFSAGRNRMGNLAKAHGIEPWWSC